MHKMNSLVAAMTMAFVGFNATVAMAADGPVTIRFSHVVKADTPKGKAADKFKELAEKYTSGKVKVEVYPNSQLLTDDNEIKAVISGDVEMIAPSFAKMTGLGIKEFQALDVPFLFEKQSDVAKVLDGAVGKSLLKKMESKDMEGLAFWDNGFKQMHGNKPMKTPADMDGLRMRIQPSKVLEAQMRAVGVRPRPMAFSELSTALTYNLVDGSENPTSNFYTQKLHEVQKHITMTNHGYLGYVVVANKNWWNGLPKDIQVALNKAMDETTVFEREIAAKDNEDALEKIKATRKVRVNMVTPGEKKLWKDSMSKIDNGLDEETKKIVLEIRASTAK